MRVFVAGGSGAIGVPLVRALVAAGHQVTALTRSAGKEPMLRALGASVAVADALDGPALKAAVVAAGPTHVVHQLTALPKEGPRRASQVAGTNRLRIDGTRHLLDAAIAAGARRLVGGSFALMAGTAEQRPRAAREAVDAVFSMESQILDASRAGRIEGIVLRYGLFYGPGNPGTERLVALVRRRLLPVVRGDRGRLPWIHVEDAVAATIAALDRGAPGRTYDIVDDQAASMSEIVRVVAEYAGAPAPFAVPAWLTRLLTPYLAGIMSLRLPLSNANARAELGWRPAFSTPRDGFSRMFARAG